MPIWQMKPNTARQRRQSSNTPPSTNARNRVAPWGHHAGSTSTANGVRGRSRCTRTRNAGRRRRRRRRVLLPGPPRVVAAGPGRVAERLEEQPQRLDPSRLDPRPVPAVPGRTKAVWTMILSALLGQ